VPTTKVVENIKIYLYAKFHIFLRSPSISLFLFSPADLFNWKKDLNSKYRHGPVSPRSAQLGASHGPIQLAKPAAPSVSSGRCQADPSASQTPPISLTSSRAKNLYAPDPLPRPLRSNPSPSSARPIPTAGVIPAKFMMQAFGQGCLMPPHRIPSM
jgi:hypothetical protein